MEKHKIYVLIDPTTNEIRYVGRTVQKLKNRLKKHLNAKDKSYRVNWIKSLTNLLVTPKIELICETDSFENCKELESYYIAKFLNEGCRLTNMTNGGDGSIGYKHSDYSKNKMSVSTKKRMTDNDVLQNLKEKGILRWKNKTYEEKMDNILMQPNRRNIIQLDLNGNIINEFKSLREIERELGYFRSNISPCIKGVFKQAYGFLWKYK